MISLVMTVLNERKGVEGFIRGMKSQLRQPDEIIIVDGGSTDGTPAYLTEALKEFACSTNVMVDPTCNIRFHPSPVARGRNMAIRRAEGDIIVATDAGCRMDATWLDELVKPLLADPSIDVVGGRTEAWAETPREQAFASVLRPRSLTEASSRCVAFRRTAWKEVGGYPEITLTAEDTAFNDRLRKAGKTTVFSEEAIVYWRMPATWKRFCRTVYRYSKGDGICALHVEMHIMKAVKWVFFPVGLVLSLRRYGLVHAVADFARLAGFAVGVIQRCRLQLAGLRAR